jgi:hypothetical protein
MFLSLLVFCRLFPALTVSGAFSGVVIFIQVRFASSRIERVLSVVASSFASALCDAAAALARSLGDDQFDAGDATKTSRFLLDRFSVTGDANLFSDSA